MQSIDRRDFVSRLASLVALPLLRPVRALASPGPRLVIARFRDPELTSDSLRDGIDMGVDEARHAAEMFGGSVELRVVAIDESPIRAATDAIQVVIPGSPSPELWQHITDSARSAGAIVLNAGGRVEELYRRCERHVFHVRPSPAAFAAARTSLPPDPLGTVELWSSSLTRFGADTLNKRFAARGGHRMDSATWAGWFAVKSAWEAATSSHATSIDSLIAFLERPTARFDGHKGVALRFGRDHQLRQPLYLVKGPKVLGEADALPDAPGACS